MERFTNKSPGALTMEQAIARHKKRIAEDRRQRQHARELAAQGRGGDTEIAHVALGELVVPETLQTPAVLNALHRAAMDADIPLEQLRVGSAQNSINPRTGQPEFSLLGDAWDRTKNSIAGMFGRDETQVPTAPGVAPPSPVPPSGMGTMQIPIKPNDVKLDSGIVQPAYSAPPRAAHLPPYDPRLVPNRMKDLEIPEVKAFLDVVSKAEGAGFHTVVGNNRFPMGRLAPDLSQFPGRGSGGTASGAYQILEKNYDDLSGQMGLQGFDPQTQRLMAAQLLQRAVEKEKPGTESALEALRRGDYNAALKLAGPTWVSLPGAPHPNKHVTPDELRSYYEERLKLYRQ